MVSFHPHINYLNRTIVCIATKRLTFLILYCCHARKANCSYLFITLQRYRPGFHPHINYLNRTIVCIATKRLTFLILYCCHARKANCSYLFITLQRHRQVLEGLARKQCFVYLDDIFRTWEEHLQNLELVTERLKKAGLHLKPKKCAFARQKVTYLGHVISEAGISVDPTKIEKIQSYPIPMGLKPLRQFLGIASYYRRFTPQFSKCMPSHVRIHPSYGLHHVKQHLKS